MRKRLRIWAPGAMAIVALAGCGGGGEEGTAPNGTWTTTEAQATGGGSERKSPDRVTIEADGTTVTIKGLGEVSFLTIESNRTGRAAIRIGTCETLGKVVMEVGKVTGLLASELNIKLDELIAGGHVLTIGDSFCVALQPA